MCIQDRAGRIVGMDVFGQSCHTIVVPLFVEPNLELLAYHIWPCESDKHHMLAF